MPTTFGIEEEFVILDPTTLTAVDCAPAFTEVVPSGGTVAHEFFRSQIEFASPVFTDAGDALDSLRDFRRRLGDWAAGAGLVAAGTGTPFRTAPNARISAGDRYAHIAADVAGVTPEHQINGLHVHVGIPDRDAGVRASNALRPWLPTLLAMSADSPFWHGADSGFDSWRAIHSRRWTTYGIPPVFHDADHYDDTIAALTDIGATTDPGTINWNVRLSETYPTVEVRVCDAQLDPSSAVALALIIRALVERATEPRPSAPPEVMDAALWHAARHGVATTLVHPYTSGLLPAGDILRLLQELIRPESMTGLERHCIRGLFARLAAGESGAAAQRRAALRGEGALATLYRDSLIAAPEAYSLVRRP